MQGGPSQVDTFDPKPVLNRLDGQPTPPSFFGEDISLAQIKVNESKLLGTKRVFQRHGKSGLEISDLFPHLRATRTTWRWSGPVITNRSFTAPRSA